jgi:hypothetical protein
VPELSHIDPRSAALLVMDYQVDVLTKFMTAAQSADAIACVPELIAAAREVAPVIDWPRCATGSNCNQRHSGPISATHW